MNDALPFTAVVGQEEAKLALVLAACDRRVGGVLLRGDKGTAKTTLARGLARLLPGDAPFVELPLGATEDRVVGSLDLPSALTGGEMRFSPGLLHEVHGGLLYVDEINLLADHLVDVLLDVAASGVNRVEREGISHSHPSSFVLIGSMNPEEGDLRPQLLDRFGLAVDVRTPTDVAQRSAALRRRLDFDDALDEDRRRALQIEEEQLTARLLGAVPASLPDELVAKVAELCAAAGAEGLRADITICRAAAALAGWEGRAVTAWQDVRRVAPLALAHRARRDPLQSAGLDQPTLERILGDNEPGSGGEAQERVAKPDEERSSPGISGTRPTPLARVPHPLTAPAGRHVPAEARRGRIVGDLPAGRTVGDVALGATVRRAAGRRAGGVADPPEGPLVQREDLRQAVRRQRRSNLVVVAVDASGSMGATGRMEAAKGVVLALLKDAYQSRDLVSLVTFRKTDAQVVLRPTASVEVARARLGSLPTGGRTPLAAGIATALEVASAPGRALTHDPFIVLLTDGRATSGRDGSDPLDSARQAAAMVARSGIPSLVVDVESDGQPGSRLGLASELASLMGARYVAMADLRPDSVREVVKTAAARR